MGVEEVFPGAGVLPLIKEQRTVWGFSVAADIPYTPLGGIVTLQDIVVTNMCNHDAHFKRILNYS